MNRDKIIALTNKLSFFLIILLLYWVFIFIITTVFDFKVFRENITQTFATSILGIFVLLGGAVILNVMLNLTKISESLSAKETTSPGPERKVDKSRVWLILFFVSFPVIFGLFYLGDLRTSYVKRNLLVNAATAIIQENRETLERLGEYQYNTTYLEEVQSTLLLFAKQEESFQSIMLIVEDEMQGKKLFLGLNHIYEKLPDKTANIFSCSKDEREYLRKVFAGEDSTHRFSSSDGRYELYYPVKTKNRIIVLYFTDYQRYGKFGS